MSVTITARCGLAALALAASGGMASADGTPPFFGYSGYFGQPTTVYTHDPDIRQATTMREGYQGLGVVTYTPGGPFWGYQPTRTRAYAPPPRRRVVRSKG